MSRRPCFSLYRHRPLQELAISVYLILVSSPEEVRFRFWALIRAWRTRSFRSVCETCPMQLRFCQTDQRGISAGGAGNSSSTLNLEFKDQVTPRYHVCFVCSRQCTPWSTKWLRQSHRRKPCLVNHGVVRR
ncbi:hypothetical protein P152DRAFT_23613 [Eremomyces bilateralis CBS 781.70]|uniref:Uncharacterized protein n=1 Tax=Eremomyces bilateralis CBS 781.70 TaxID=1392243 RepID=A0A6G1GHL4_9PEZI|nr:uncharacterized protein P152DRAFT_23613 [Eremomyces bilateralis CBS 781.70]KAF1817587.1 hypothetical protein P152DRAFT_23613 [Eremomyces bilateralis CBS 781.70]